MGDVPSRKGYPTLLEKLKEDLSQPDPRCPVIICATGDFAESGDTVEFAQALGFCKGLSSAEIFGKVRGLGSMLVVPGNHDVVYDKSSPSLRLANYTWFTNSLFGSGFADSDPSNWELVRDDFDATGVISACLNSSMYVEKGKADQDRGNIDLDQLTKLDRSLKGIAPGRLQGAIKVALIHHHPVLIPGLAEPGRGYDAVLNSGRLLAILRKHGFHVVLHGHKHDPYVFTEDSRSAHRASLQNPILVAAGGSLGSTELPTNRWNCYNRISIKWHPSAGQARIKIDTVGLSVFDEDGNEALPENWCWQVLRSEDIHFLKGDCIPHRCDQALPISITNLPVSAEQRGQEYARLRGNMLAVEVRPSLHPDQGYEAIVWIIPHNRRPEDEPIRVEWSAGKKFGIASLIAKEHDSRFCASFDYWGPMMIQARLIFSDGTEVFGFIYARIPEDCGAKA
jgi:3',5'-cyclic AMP phosphodiesterase CpdA